MIRYLNQEEKEKSRTMYETNFPEDTKAFVDYYYEWKTKDNRILVQEEEEQLQVMMHLNPFAMRMCGETISANYIVAVATEESVRRQGKMAGLMSYALQDMAKQHQPFTFLIPANPRVYVPSGFAFVSGEKYEKYEALLGTKRNFDKVSCLMTEKTMHWGAGGTEEILLRKATEADDFKVAVFANALLEQKFDVFSWRTEAYYRRMREELASQNGELVLIERAGELRGIFSYGQGAEQAELQEILLCAELEESFVNLVTGYIKGQKARIAEMNFMVRILDLQVLGLLLRSKEPFTMKVLVQDDIIAENSGAYEIRADKDGSSIKRIAQKEVEKVMDIAELTRALFGQMKIAIREWV